MKKTKLIMPILGAATIGAVAPVATLTSCSQNVNVVSLAEGSSASKEIGYKATYAYYNFKQENIKEPESTKVKLAKLVANGTEVTPVAGLVTSTADSAGNISVKFNLAIFKTQYNATEASFDLIFTNKKAGTSYTLTGFSANFSEIEELTQQDFILEYDERYQAYRNRVGTLDKTANPDYNKVVVDIENDWFEYEFQPAGGGEAFTQIVSINDIVLLQTSISYEAGAFPTYDAINRIKGQVTAKSETFDISLEMMGGGIYTPGMMQNVTAIEKAVSNKTGGCTLEFTMSGQNLCLAAYGKDDKLYFDVAVNQNCYIVYQNIPEMSIQLTATDTLPRGSFHFTYSKE